jgi:uncharacterized membrane protein
MSLVHKPIKIIAALYGLCAATMLVLHACGFLTGERRFHTWGWYALGAGLAIGSVPLLLGLAHVAFVHLRRK